MEIVVTMPGGARVDAQVRSHTVRTDQPPQGGGADLAPMPYELFLASIGTCAGIYVLGFCRQRELSTDGIRIVQRVEYDAETRLASRISLDIEVPPSFPEKYYSALVRAADQCKVKKQMEHPPVFETNTVVTA